MSRFQRHQSGQPGFRLAVLIGVLAVSAGFLILQTAPAIKQAFEPIRGVADDSVVATAMPKRGFFYRIRHMWTSQARVDELEAEVRDLAIWRDAAIAMASRMEQYESILSLVGEPPVVGVTARVITETNGPFAETRLANAGFTQGVREGAVAINTHGLVGRVIRVGTESSRILMVTDYNSRVPVLGRQSRVRGIVAGGRNGPALFIDSPELGLVEGEMLITTGEGGAFPQGLRVGTARQAGNDWLIDLSFRQGAVDFVRLLPQQPIPAPEDNPVAPNVTERPIEASPDGAEPNSSAQLDVSVTAQ